MACPWPWAASLTSGTSTTFVRDPCLGDRASPRGVEAAVGLTWQGKTGDDPHAAAARRAVDPGGDAEPRFEPYVALLRLARRLVCEERNKFAKVLAIFTAGGVCRWSGSDADGNSSQLSHDFPISQTHRCPITRIPSASAAAATVAHGSVPAAACTRRRAGRPSCRMFLAGPRDFGFQPVSRWARALKGF